MPLMTSLSRVLSGICPDERCQARLFFPGYDTSVECTRCGQRHDRHSLLNLEEVTNPNVALSALVRNVLGSAAIAPPKKGVEMVKVRGLSNYHCKLLSPLLTYYGMDRRTSKAILLRDMNQGEVFDCAVLGDRAFLIEPEHVDIIGYGRDISGSATYLADTLTTIHAYNGNEECLLPVHADGDGHCLVHAVSRALVGRELFWHPLRVNLKMHFQTHIEKYKELFCDFIDVSEWVGIIDECDPDFQPPDGELLGLRNIHVFGLANVLHRPILLLDSLSGMQSSGDYSALFLPGLVDPQECRGKSGKLNKPLCIAWSSSGRNHYIPLVGLRRAPGELPKLPRCLIPKPWGVNESLVDDYLDFDESQSISIGGEKCLQDSYVQRLAAAMEEVFLQEHGVHPAVVADVHHYLYRRTGVVAPLVKEVLASTQRAIEDARLYRCIVCDAVSEHTVVPEWFLRTGDLYKLAVQNYGKLSDEKTYSFPMQGVTCRYDSKKDELIPDLKKSVLERCSLCRGNMRIVNRDGSIQYKNGDRTNTPSESNTCNCGHKHYWDGKEYDNLPQLITVTLDWMGKQIEERVAWFQYESNPTLNSNVYEVANGLLQKHFPGIFGIERLAQKVVDQILEKTKKPEELQQLPAVSASSSINHEDGDSEMTRESPSKIIITGYKTLHKEELTMSETERALKQRIEANALRHQRRASAERPASGPRTGTPPSSVSRGQQRPVARSSGSSPTTPKHGVPVAEDRSLNFAVSSPQKTLMTSTTAKMIRISTSDGQQLQLSLDSVSTLDDLKRELSTRLGVPAERQRILYGFPPRELIHSTATTGTGSTEPLPFQHGDKISVEVLAPAAIVSDEIKATANEIGSILSSQSGREALSERLQDMQNSNMDNLDAAVTSLALTASLSGQTLWSYVQNMPQLFANGGLLYRQVERDVGLVHGKHCRLPYLFDKSFCYNAEADRLEICLEPHGHFAVAPGIAERFSSTVKTATTSTINPTVNRGHAMTSQEQLIASVLNSVSGSNPATSESQQLPSSSGRLSGTSGVVVSKSTEMLAAHTPFQGQGYSMTARKADDGEDGVEKMDAAESSSLMAQSLDSMVHSDAAASAPMPFRTRIAPGVSVLNSEVSSATNANVERLQNLLRSLGERVGDSMDTYQPSRIRNVPRTGSQSDENDATDDLNVAAQDSPIAKNEESMDQ